MPDVHLVLDRLSARDRGRTVLDNLSLALARGQTLALLGPTGAGKTATLMLLAGFLRPTLGSVRLGGRDITVAPPHTRDIAMAFQDDALFPHLSVLDNVAFGLKMRGMPRGERRARAAATLAALRIGELAARAPARLAASERRMVSLARAAAARPALLLVDEPSAPEDAATREAVRMVLGEALGPDHATAILATHDRAAAFGLADRVALLREGRLEQIGTPRELYERPASRFVAGFTGGCNMLAAVLLREQGGAAVVSIAGHTAAARCAPGMPPGPVLLCLRPHRLRVAPTGSLLGVIVSLSYQGAVTRATLQVGAESCVAELVQAPPGLARGATLALGWDAADGWLLPAATPATAH
jgi:putative spermidine/putrescine transport system ATP-binding protein